MIFSVIYSVDVPKEESLTPYLPKRRKLWQTTETRGDDPEMKHRKLCALLTKKQFIEFVEEHGLFAESKTMGTIGAPGFGIGWAPAISFGSVNPCAYQNAYVTPIPTRKKSDEPIRKGVFTNRDWDRLEKRLFEVFGH